MECNCENQGGDCEGKVKMRKAMTAYPWERNSGKPNPNADFPACESHWEEYRDYWQERWDEYYGGCL